MRGDLRAGLFEAQRLAAFALQQFHHVQAVAAFQGRFQQPRRTAQQALLEFRDGLSRLDPAQFAAFVLRRAGGEAHGFLGETLGMLAQLGDQRFGGFPLLRPALQIVRRAGQQHVAQAHPPGAEQACGVGLVPGPAVRLVGLRHLHLAFQKLADQRLFLGLIVLAQGNQAQRLGALQQQLPHDQGAAGSNQRFGMAGGRVVLQFAGKDVLGDLHPVHLQVRQFDLFHAFAVVGTTHLDNLQAVDKPHGLIHPTGTSGRMTRQRYPPSPHATRRFCRTT
ncbi:hypothetical protein D9M71_214870 [compost metagenome]